MRRRRTGGVVRPHADWPNGVRAFGSGAEHDFTVFAACVIGRISLNGGRGSILGALCGVILLGIISNIVTLSNIQTFWISATYGAIILLSLILTRLTSGKSYRSD